MSRKSAEEVSRLRRAVAAGAGSHEIRRLLELVEKAESARFRADTEARPRPIPGEDLVMPDRTTFLVLAAGPGKEDGAPGPGFDAHGMRETLAGHGMRVASVELDREIRTPELALSSRWIVVLEHEDGSSRDLTADMERFVAGLRVVGFAGESSIEQVLPFHDRIALLRIRRSDAAAFPPDAPRVPLSEAGVEEWPAGERVILVEALRRMGEGPPPTPTTLPRCDASAALAAILESVCSGELDEATSLDLLRIRLRILKAAPARTGPLGATSRPSGTT